MLTALAPAPPAGAGGAVLHTEERWYAPGQVATARVGFAEVDGMGTVEDGPYYAYLLTRTGRWIRRGQPVPEHAIPVGMLRILRSDNRYEDGVAVLRFTVPEIATGDYTIQVCNAGCETSLGDITWGEIRVARTATESDLLTRATRATYMVASLRRSIRRGDRSIDALERELEWSRDTTEELMRANRTLETRAEALERRLASLTRRSPLVEADPRAVWPVVVLLAAAVALLAFAASRRPRRRDFRTLLGTNVFPVILGGNRAWPKTPGSPTTIRRDVSRSSRVPISNATSGGTGSSDPTA
jgi:hypothetical protein